MSTEPTQGRLAVPDPRCTEPTCIDCWEVTDVPAISVARVLELIDAEGREWDIERGLQMFSFEEYEVAKQALRDLRAAIEKETGQ